eukprot:TRINITY_DN907_c0_g2_i3.p1 TRINITY_DN907_c0_g2~~TRINITY_DN907_c0_g2_i3.p1  ORF type:complete len:729 (+),score=213.01 TRINITY_DN907_c0_g2_i3:151-2337(+)
MSEGIPPPSANLSATEPGAAGAQPPVLDDSPAVSSISFSSAPDLEDAALAQRKDAAVPSLEPVFEIEAVAATAVGECAEQHNVVGDSRRGTNAATDAYDAYCAKELGIDINAIRSSSRKATVPKSLETTVADEARSSLQSRSAQDILMSAQQSQLELLDMLLRNKKPAKKVSKKSKEIDGEDATGGSSRTSRNAKAKKSAGGSSRAVERDIPEKVNQRNPSPFTVFRAEDNDDLESLIPSDLYDVVDIDFRIIRLTADFDLQRLTKSNLALLGRLYFEFKFCVAPDTLDLTIQALNFIAQAPIPDQARERLEYLKTQMENDFKIVINAPEKSVKVQNVQRFSHIGHMNRFLIALRSNKLEIEANDLNWIMKQSLLFHSPNQSHVDVRNELFLNLKLFSKLGDRSPGFRLIHLAYTKLNPLERAANVDLIYKKVKKELQKGFLTGDDGTEYRMERLESDAVYASSSKPPNESRQVSLQSVPDLKLPDAVASLEESSDESDEEKEVPVLAGALNDLMSLDPVTKTLHIKFYATTQVDLRSLTKEDLLYLDELIEQKHYSFSQNSLGLAKVLLDNILNVFLTNNVPIYVYQQTVRLREKVGQEFFVELTVQGMFVQNWKNFGKLSHFEYLINFFSKGLSFSDAVPTEAIQFMCRKAIVLETSTPEQKVVRGEAMTQLKLIEEARLGKSGNLDPSKVHLAYHELSPEERGKVLSEVCKLVKLKTGTKFGQTI